jgi:hypothetical protein
MNRHFVKVYIKWLKKGIEHTIIPPNGIRFCPQIRFDDEQNVQPIWTAEIIIRKWGNSSSCYADLRYLFDHAPNYLLKKGKKFIVFDGPNAIAEGEILND